MGNSSVGLTINLGLFDKASAGFAKFASNAENALGRTEKALAAAEQAGQKFSRTSQALNTAGIALGAAGLGLGLAAKSGLDASMEMEGHMAKLTVALKDGAKAAEMMAWAKKKAAETPFEMNNVVDAATRLELYGLSATEWFDSVGNMAGAMGKDVTQGVEAIADAVSGGGLERLKEFGISGAQLKAAGWSGDYGVAGIESLKAALKSVMDQKFGGGMEKMMGTAKGALSNFSDAVFQIKVAVGDALFPALKAITPVLTSFANAFAKLAATPLGQAFIVTGFAVTGLTLVLGIGLIAVAKAVLSWRQLTAAMAANATQAATTGAANAAAGAGAAAGGAGAAARGAGGLAGGALGGLKSIGLKALAFLAPLGPALASLWGFIAPVVAGIGAALAGIGTAIAALPLATIAGVVAAVVGLGIGIYELVTNWGAVSEWFKGIGAALVEGVGGAWNAVVQFFSDLPANLGQMLGDMVATFEFGVSYMVGAILSFPGAMQQGLQDASAALWAWITDTWTGFVQWAQGVPAAIGEGLSSAYAAVVGWFQSLPGAIAEGMAAFGQGIQDGLAAAWQAVVGFFQGIWQYLKELPGRMWQGAKDAVGGFANAFKGQAGTAAGNVSAGFSAGMNAWGGARAGGGPVAAGMAYLVGERGPEVFTASRSGYIMPNAALAGAGGGGGVITVELVGSELDARILKVTGGENVRVVRRW